MYGVDATGEEGISSSYTEQWKDGHVLTFWAYDHNYPGTTNYHVYYTQKDFLKNENYAQRFALSTYNQTETDIPNGWKLSFSFWAFKDKFVDNFIGKPLTLNYDKLLFAGHSLSQT